jgi:hypothetical protein
VSQGSVDALTTRRGRVAGAHAARAPQLGKLMRQPLRSALREGDESMLATEAARIGAKDTRIIRWASPLDPMCVCSFSLCPVFAHENGSNTELVGPDGSELRMAEEGEDGNRAARCSSGP